MPGKLLARFNHILKDIQVIDKEPRNKASRSVAWFKLNVDGSYRGNLGSGGGDDITCDEFGNLKVAFSKKFEIGMNNGVELQAMISGKKLGKTLGIWNVIIETNLELVIGWIRKNQCSLLSMFGITGIIFKKSYRECTFL